MSVPSPIAATLHALFSPGRSVTDTDFSALPLAAPMLANLTALGYTRMTPIQAQSLPPILAGSDVIAQAKTGSGKTAAFAIGLLAALTPRLYRCQALVLCPTRELAEQVTQEVRRLARGEDNIKVLTLGGGVAMGPQVGSLEHGVQIVVGTPGRVQKHLLRGSLNLAELRTLVLDEADRMLDMGFYDSIAAIVTETPATRQTLLFSATYPDAIRKLAGNMMRKPVSVSVDVEHENGRITQRFYQIDADQRLATVLAVLACYRPQSAVAFCFTREQCQQLTDYLNRQGVAAEALHGDMEQRDRDRVLVKFANRSLSVLVATDVAARGLDIEVLDLVINVELGRDVDTHIHRIGRTGRAGEKGLAISLVAPPEQRRADAIVARQPSAIEWHSPASLKAQPGGLPEASMVTLNIAGGRKDKLRPGDILGALTGEAGLRGDQVGKITVLDQQAFVAVNRELAERALTCLQAGKIKGRSFRVRRV